MDPESDTHTQGAKVEAQIANETSGYFLIGLKGDIEDDSDEISGSDEEHPTGENQRISKRRLYVQTKPPFKPDTSTAASSLPSTPRSSSRHPPPAPEPEPNGPSAPLRVIVYVHRPFIYTFLFDPETASLSTPLFYRNLHTFLAPLQKLLLRRTGPHTARQRMSSLPPSKHDDEVWDLMHDANDLATCASIPNIPSLEARAGGRKAEGGWSRIDALNVHSAMLEVIRGTRDGNEADDEVERSVKTGRGWWVVWMKVNDDDDGGGGGGERKAKTPEQGDDGYFDTRSGSGSGRSPTRDGSGKDVLLVRRARDASALAEKGKGRSVSGWGFGLKDGSRAESGGLGIGFDARRYVEGLVGIGR
jgi:hypothetical protein